MSEELDLDDSTRGSLQSLLSVNIDSYKGWEEAAEHTKDLSLQTFFREMSDVRKHNADELRQLVAEAGVDPADHGSISGQLHRWWIDAKQAIAGGDAKSVLNEAERGEDSIKHEYEQALGSIHNTEALDLVQRQYRNIAQEHNRVREMRDHYRNPRG
jgi:uncharacterized protein (TIGR02284 family)